MENVKKAIQHWEKNTCLEFVERHSHKYKELKKKINHDLYISIGTGMGCSSHVGYIKYFNPQITLQEPGCTQIRAIVHEIGHAVGFFHTQSRPDRDNYVAVNFKNIQRGMESNFEKMSYQSYGIYDHSSVMHYGRKAFGIIMNGKQLTTVSSKDENLNELLGNRGGLTYYDIMAANIAYKCADHCKQKDKDECHNGGFRFKDCSCVCPKGLTGTNCEEIELSWRNNDCAKNITLEEGGTTNITSPNYPQPYGRVKCLWLIKAPAGKHLNVNLTLKKLPSNRRTHECHHWVDIAYNRIGQEGLRFCGKNAKRDLPLSSENMVMVKFDGSKKKRPGKGFMMNISVA